MIDFMNVSTLVDCSRGLQVCIADTRPIRVLQWQCQGNVSTRPQRWVYTTDDDCIDKAFSFIRLAKERCPDLLLTPEYSFPYDALEAVIRDPELWPGQGALWCLGMEGDSKGGVATKLERWETVQDVIVHREAFQRLTNGQYVDALIYLFISDTGELNVLPQFKTTPMSDSWNEDEAGGLSTSNLIFVFDLHGASADRNRFLSVICSDALGVSPGAILQQTADKHTLIFHAQLNPNPRHETFRLFRSGLLDVFDGREIRLITLNWADGTKVDGKSFDMPWSAFYKKNTSEQLPERELRVRNHEKGTFYALHKYNEIWYSHREEHCKEYYVNKGFRTGVSFAAIRHREPITQSYYIYDKSAQHWNDSLATPSSLSQIIGSHGEAYDFPLYASFDDCDAFFGLCFGHFLEGELSADDSEVVSRMFNGSDKESDILRNDKAKEYQKLVKLIMRKKFPKELIELIDNHQLFVDSSSVEDKQLKFGNVYPRNIPIDQVSSQQSALFVISKHTDRDKVREQLDLLSSRLHLSFRKRVVIYYLSDETHRYEYFEEHLDQTRVDKATFYKEITSIH